jgi:predicted DNA-binding transcriptional regulator YafY
MTVAELSRLCGVTRRTIQRDLHELDEAGVPVLASGDPPRYSVSDGYCLPPLMLTLPDALALYIAGLSMASDHPRMDPQIGHALKALASVLPAEMGDHLRVRASNLPSEQGDGAAGSVLTALALGWALQRKVRVAYRAADGEPPRSDTLCPHYLEPSAIHEAPLLYGCSSDGSPVEGLSTAGILEAELTAETFAVPVASSP